MIQSAINLGIGVYAAATYSTILAGGVAISALQKTGVTKTQSFQAGLSFVENAGYGFLDRITRHQTSQTSLWNKPDPEDLRLLFQSLRDV